VLLAAVYKSPGHAWNDTDITELLSSWHKALLAGDLNAKHPFWNSVVSNPSGMNLLNVLHTNEFEISAPQCPTHYSLRKMVTCSILLWTRMSGCQKSLSLIFWTQDHLPIVFHLLDHIRTRNLSDPDDKFTDWERFQSLAFELISPWIQINWEKEADKAARDFIVL
jgi:hypothetical protein